MKGFKDGAGYPMAGHYSTRRKPPHKNADNLTGSLADRMPRDDGNLIFEFPLQASTLVQVAVHSSNVYQAGPSVRR